jgi:hypothetical protein
MPKNAENFNWVACYVICSKRFEYEYKLLTAKQKTATKINRNQQKKCRKKAQKNAEKIIA